MTKYAQTRHKPHKPPICRALAPFQGTKKANGRAHPIQQYGTTTKPALDKKTPAKRGFPTDDDKDPKYRGAGIRTRDLTVPNYV
jgi:hypothetical protein